MSVMSASTASGGRVRSDLVIPDVSPNQRRTRVGERHAGGTVNPDKEGEVSCRFLWGTTLAFGQSSRANRAVSEGESPVLVQAISTDSSPIPTITTACRRRTQTARTQANEDRTSSSRRPGPRSARSPSRTWRTSATLDATVDPNDASTSYYFQYGTDSTYGTDAPAPPGGDLGSGESDVEVSRHVQGLVAGYRLSLSSRRAQRSEPGAKDESLTARIRHLPRKPRWGPCLAGRSSSGRWCSPAQKLGALVDTTITADPGFCLRRCDYVHRRARRLKPTLRRSVQNAGVLHARYVGDWSSRDLHCTS